ncbi:hypothetical protein VOLCADRAFT_83968 [Volvox carteri f. nagariensis]|uniref:Ketoreductase domain-containing protein n=1 Tax=Volvox carteri f. nagariensis TaxID=3068 RepID=D8UES5_VOLCA|nr:uncharacterized protein VOLCADRAFT_83968 [Volvox carteri f. nagariensis]EFJ41781.1 hypothetical protein VOLCADRAFT_83968 [Volvox carteri f. nagariensis]|eukprot:XP_002957127.1 hypothetical protein VOLCADRAFT_83968 [Volvox carteri f. nagariensis]
MSAADFVLGHPALVVVGAAISFFCYKLVRLAFSDADLHLLSLGMHKSNAFTDKVVWITGASQGLGAVLAKYFASLGARVILSSRDTSKLTQVKQSLGLLDERVLVLPFDLGSPYEELEMAAAAADSAFGSAGVDYLIHNAGKMDQQGDTQHALASETTAAVTDALIQLNAVGPIKLTRAMLPHMLRRNRGRIVVVGSMSSKLPSPGQAVYAAAKMALYGYFSSLATELADTNVGVTICCPGPVATGSEELPRVVYGPAGRIVQNATGSSNRLDPARAAQLIASAAAHGVDEAWIAQHPVLAMGYIFQLVPRLGWLLLKMIGPKRARLIKDGKSGYNVGKLIT